MKPPFIRKVNASLDSTNTITDFIQPGRKYANTNLLFTTAITPPETPDLGGRPTSKAHRPA